nr:tetratricopeptide repeat protein [Desulfobulbaceae bacterium]
MSRKLKKNRSKPFKKQPFNISELFHDGLAHHQAGNFEDASTVYNTILQAKPNHTDSLNLLGLIAQQNGDFHKAERLAQKALAIKTDPAFLTNLGSAYKGQKKYSQAITAYKKALQIKPDFIEALFNLANTLFENHDYVEAEGYFKKTLQLKPNMHEARNRLGRTYNQLADHEEAINCFNHVLKSEPGNLQARNNVGYSLQELGRLDEAIDQYKKALEYHPERPELQNNIGNVLVRQGKFHEAINWYQQAVTSQPDYEEANVNLAWTYGQHGLYKESIRCLQNLCARKTDSHYAYSDLLFNCNYDPSLNNNDLFEAAKEWWVRFTKSAEGKNLKTNLQTGPKKAGEVLNIGFMSPDFRQHPVGLFILPLLQNISESGFKIFCYAEMGSSNHDAITLEIMQLSDSWYSTRGVDDEKVAEKISSDKIDILIDLAGHSANNRLPVMARKPAPLQASWLGYVNTTGLPVIDYRLTDQIANPGGSELYYSESLVYLPHGFFCYLPPAECPDVAPLPALASGQITFGSFNNIIKITEEVLEVWAKIVIAVPNSKLLWVSKAFTDRHIQAHFLNIFNSHGVPASRIEMVSNLPMKEYLATHNRVDIALDPFPHNGHTITCHSLWMGVPVITLKGDRYATRMGASLMTRIDLENYIAESKDDYIEKARALAANIEELKKLRSTMRNRMLSSPICDAKQFTREFELALLKIWKHHNETKP